MKKTGSITSKIRGRPRGFPVAGEYSELETTEGPRTPELDLGTTNG